MNIECPNCKTENKINTGEHFHCHKCQQCFTGFSFSKYKMSLIATGLSMLGGAYIGISFDGRFLEPKRYPTATIFEIVSHCSAPRNISIQKTEQEKLAIACVCALDKTMAQISEDKFRANSNEFISAFKTNMRTCR